MNKLIVVRAGTTAWQEQDRIQGTVPLPLCDAGKDILDLAAALLKQEQATTLYCSGNESSGTSAEYLCQQCGFKLKKIVEFKEMEFGLWQGLRIKDIQNRYSSVYKQWRKDPFSIYPPQGETLQAVRNRVEPALQKLLDKNSGKTIIVVAARITAAVMDCIMTDTPLERLWEQADNNTTMQQYIRDSSTPQAQRTTLIGPPADNTVQKVTA